MSIRHAKAADASQVADLLVTLGAEGVDEQEALRRLARQEEEVLVVDIDGQLHGLVSMKVELYFGHSLPLMHLTALVTRTSGRRSGVARDLVEAVFQRAAELDCVGVELTCGLTPARAPAHEFYSSLEFERTSYRYWRPLGDLAQGSSRGSEAPSSPWPLRVAPGQP